MNRFKMHVVNCAMLGAFEGAGIDGGAVRKVCRCEPVTDVTGVAAPRLDGNSLVLRPRCLKIRGIVPEGNTLGVPHQRARWFAMTERFPTAPSFGVRDSGWMEAANHAALPSCKKANTHSAA